MLTNRPIVIPASSLVRVQPMMNDRDEIYVTFDGQAGFQLQAGDESHAAHLADGHPVHPPQREAQRPPAPHVHRELAAAARHRARSGPEGRHPPRPPADLDLIDAGG